MNVTLSRKRIIQIAVVLLLLVGVGIGLYLIRNPQIFRPRASTHVVNAFEFKDAEGNLIRCDTSTNPPTCVTPTLDISVSIKDSTLLNP